MRKSVVIYGPTASGKSDLGIRLAQQLEGEVINADARQVYAGMQVGTGAVEKADQGGIPHHLLGTRDPASSYNAAVFLEEAERCEVEIRDRGHVPIYVGGTGLYVEALLEGLHPMPPVDTALRASLEERARLEGAQRLWEELSRLDPVGSSSISPHNLRYILRALEIYHQTGELPSQRTRPRTAQRPLHILAIHWDPEVLRRRIAERHRQIFSGSQFDEEVRLLMQRPVAPEVWKTIGFEEMRGFLLSVWSREEALERTIRAATAYAKRQRTWLRRMMLRHPVTIIPGEELTDQTDLLGLLQRMPDPT